ncbi:PhoX family protein [Haliea sp.]
MLKFHLHSVSFSPVPVAEGTGPVPSISADYQYEVLIPWGTSLDNTVTDYLGDPDTRSSAAQQAQQVGIGHDGMWFFPFRGSNTRGLLAINHEFGGNGTVLGKAAPESVADVNTSQHAHGISVVEIRKQNGSWKLVKGSKYNRRVHVNTPVTFSGPVAGSDLIASDSVPMGTVNNCANGYTPWVAASTRASPLLKAAADASLATWGTTSALTISTSLSPSATGNPCAPRA